MEDFDNIFKILDNPKRRIILLVLDQVGAATYTELMKLTGIRETGTLAFHLKKLSGLIVKEEGLYKLSARGKLIVDLIRKSSQKGIIEMREELPSYLSFGVNIPVGRYFLTIISSIIFAIYLVFVSINLINSLFLGVNILLDIKAFSSFSELMGILAGTVLAADLAFRSYSYRGGEYSNRDLIFFVLLYVIALFIIVYPETTILPLKTFLRGLIITSILLVPLFFILYNRSTR